MKALRIKPSILRPYSHILYRYNSTGANATTPAETPADPQAPTKFKPPKMVFEHEYQREYQKIIGYSLIPLSLIPFYTTYAGIPLDPLLDTTLATMLLAYVHYGFSSLIDTAVPKSERPRLNKFCKWNLYGATILGLCGIYELETENNGFVDLVQKVWRDEEREAFVFGRDV